jgi:SNF2 family DNA or RNA helicase
MCCNAKQPDGMNRPADCAVSSDNVFVVAGEAHRLRNVYRPDNRIGRTLKTALANAPKVLLTATPLQNSLMELYGLVSLIDDYAFGDAKSFRAQYARLTDGQFDELKTRLQPVCHRTLRRQVLEYSLTLVDEDILKNVRAVQETNDIEKVAALRRSPPNPTG